MAELWTRTPILQGATEQAQLTLISQLCGSITTEVWPGVEKLELFTKLELLKGQRRRVKERLKVYIKCPYALDLLDKLLTLDPTKRIDSGTALDHDFFWKDPMPSDLAIMLSHYNNSMFEFTTSRRRQVLPQGQGGVPPGQAGPLAPHGNFHPSGHQGRPGGPPGAPGAVGVTNAGGGQYMDRVFWWARFKDDADQLFSFALATRKFEYTTAICVCKMCIYFFDKANLFLKDF